jgi:hypothetical protein
MAYEEIIAILGEPDEEIKGVADTWRYGSVSLNNRRYRPFWEFRYNKYLGYRLTLNENRKLENLY